MRKFLNLLMPKKVATQASIKNAAIAPTDYFQLASNWADDFYLAAETAKNRWRAVCLYGFLPLTFLLLVMMVFLIPAQKIQPLLVNHYENGLISVTPIQAADFPKNRAQMESELVRYVINRESYSAASYNEQYSLVNLLSDNSIAQQYINAQSATNKNSPINTLGNKGYRTVKVESVIFLDSQDEANANNTKNPHQNLAQVNFTITDHDATTGTPTSVPLTALIAWEYRGSPKDPALMWQNWNGFTVTSYQLQQRNV